MVYIVNGHLTNKMNGFQQIHKFYLTKTYIDIDLGDIYENNFT